MVEDKNNKIYTELVSYVQSYYSDLKSGTAYSDTVGLPYLYFFQIDGSTKLTTLSNTEDGINLAFQIEIYTSDGMNKARKIAHTVREFMVEEGFRCRTYMPSIKTSSNVSRFITRFERLDV